MKDNRLSFKIHTQNLFQVPGKIDISRDQMVLFFKFDPKNHLYRAGVPAFHENCRILSFQTLLVYT